MFLQVQHSIIQWLPLRFPLLVGYRNAVDVLLAGNFLLGVAVAFYGAAF
jgi:hypothetical protein